MPPLRHVSVHLPCCAMRGRLEVFLSGLWCEDAHAADRGLRRSLHPRPRAHAADELVRALIAARTPPVWHVAAVISACSLREGEEMRREGRRLAGKRALRVRVEF